MIPAKENLLISRGRKPGEPLTIPIDRLIPFGEHPFGVDDDGQFAELCGSIRENGVFCPILVRKAEEDKFQIVSGHRRVEASRLAGRTDIPATLHNWDDDMAAVIMVETNKVQRSFRLLRPSVQAKALHMQLEAVKRLRSKKGTAQANRLIHHTLTALLEQEGDPSADLLDQEGARDANDSRSIVARKNDLAPATVARLIRLNKLSEPLLELVDADRIGLYPAVSLSYLLEEAQGQVAAILAEAGYPKVSMEAGQALRSCMIPGNGMSSRPGSFSLWRRRPGSPPQR